MNGRHRRVLSMTAVGNSLLNEKKERSETPKSSDLNYLCSKELLIQCLANCNGYGYGTTYHWVVAHTHEAHHLYVSRN